MIEIFKTRLDLERDSACSNEHINKLLQQVRELSSDMFFVETICIEDKGFLFFENKRYLRYCLYFVSENTNPFAYIFPVSVVNLGYSSLETSSEEYKTVVYLKGLLDGYKLSKL
jgi:hypothetical protein